MTWNHPWHQAFLIVCEVRISFSIFCFVLIKKFTDITAHLLDVVVFTNVHLSSKTKMTVDYSVLELPVIWPLSDKHTTEHTFNFHCCIFL